VWAVIQIESLNFNFDLSRVKAIDYLVSLLFDILDITIMLNSIDTE